MSYTNGTNGTNGRQAPVIYEGTVPDRLQPHNVEAEESVIGSLLIDPDAIIKIATLVTENDFYIERHNWIFAAIKSLYERREPADLVTLSDELERRGQLAEIGGAAYLTSLINATPTSIHAEYYARIVERTAVLRRLIGAAGDISRLAYEDKEDTREVLNRAEELVFNITSSANIRAGLAPIGNKMDSYLEKVEFLVQHKGNLIGLPTGLTDLDRLMGGLQKTDMITLAGRPGQGKTSLALAIALYNANKFQKRSAIFSLEMSDEQLIEKLMASLTGIDSMRLRKGEIKESEWPQFMSAANLLYKLPIFIDDTPAISAFELRSKSRRLHAEHGLDLIIIDYLQLMRGDSKSENRQQEVSYISRSVKALARELRVPILALSQLSRGVESRSDKKPELRDLRESGGIEQDSDAVMFIYHDPEIDNPNIFTINLEKYRGGATGTFNVYFKKPVCQFVDLTLRTTEFEPMPEREQTPPQIGKATKTYAERKAKKAKVSESAEGVESSVESSDNTIWEMEL